MKTLSVCFAQTGATFNAPDLDFATVTTDQLIHDLIESGQIPAPGAGQQYRLADKSNAIITENMSLEKAGFEDGDTATLVIKGQAA